MYAHVHSPSTSLLRILAPIIDEILFHDRYSEFLICYSLFPILETMLLNSPNKGEVSANSCASRGDNDEQAGISENAAETYL